MGVFVHSRIQTALPSHVTRTVKKHLTHHICSASFWTPLA
jgi:hypothetical protein